MSRDPYPGLHEWRTDLPRFSRELVGSGVPIKGIIAYLEENVAKLIKAVDCG